MRKRFLCRLSVGKIVHEKERNSLMWIVRLALDRPYTFVVLALLVFIFAPVVILNTAVDIFPSIDMELRWPESCGDGRPRHHDVRTQPDHYG